jgi:predicted ATPase
MRFRLATTDNRDEPLEPYPIAVLQRDNWDDYSYKTTFMVTLHLAPGKRTTLESLKICQRGQLKGRTELPKEDFTRLPDDYCSLGQSYSYYEGLAALGEQVYAPFLTGLRDMVFLPDVMEDFIEENGVQSSLLRFDSAARALEDAPQLFDDDADESESHSLCFDYEGPLQQSQDGIVTQFRFGDVRELPNRLAVVIGYNGAGKTSLLANLAMLAYADEQEAGDTSFIEQHGRYLDIPPRFGSIMAISYSAFDDFRIPGEGSSSNAKLERKQASAGLASARSYRYCGLRQVDKDGQASNSLKSIEQLTAEFHKARARALEKDRLGSLRAAMEPVFTEPSVQTIADLPEISAADSKWRKSFDRLSTGHKLVLNIVVQLCAYLERRSIVFIDEPELHLHPPLLAALLRSIGLALEEYDSFGIVATHSPVVLQEVPARYVKVLRRYFEDVSVDEPEIETFGESLGILTQHAFSLDSRDTDYRGVIEELARTYDLDEIDGFFGGHMSSQARSLAMSVQREADASS